MVNEFVWFFRTETGDLVSTKARTQLGARWQFRTLGFRERLTLVPSPIWGKPYDWRDA